MVLIVLALFALPLALAQNVQAADGDESTDSIYGFSETLPDDVMFYPDGSDFSTSDHYAESFADVSDWAESDTYPWEAGESISTDGDIGTFSAEGDGENDIDGFYTNVSLVTVPYFEIRYKLSSLDADFVYLYCVQDGSNPHIALVESTEWVTRGVKIDEWIGPVLPTNPTEILIIIRADLNVDIDIEIDYDRAGPVDEAGWQHDGSTTQGIEDNGNTHYDYYMSSDGDILNLTTVRNNASAIEPNGDFYIYYDTTAIKTNIETDYYQFFEMRYKYDIGSSSTLYLYADGKQTLRNLIADNSWHIVRVNLYVGTGTGFAYVRFNVDYTYTLNREKAGYFDWMKFYSIANLTVTQSGAETDDYLYVDSGILYSTVDEGHIEANYDPVLAVNEATYPIYNLTTHGVAPEFSYYVGSWSSYSANTRGAISGIVTGIKLKFDSTEILSAITFIEDATAPVISDFWVVPFAPIEEDNVTFAIYETDAGAGTYTVIFNAVEYPAGFVDVDFEAVESSDIDGLWSYTIDSSDLPAGYYVFEVIASDGANEGTALTIFEVEDMPDNIFYLLFLSLEMWGYLGPMIMVIIGSFLATKDRLLTIIWFIVELLFVSQYFELVGAEPNYWWHIFILLLGGLFTCVYSLWDR